MVGADNVVTFGRNRLQILPTNGRLSYARARVEGHERLDGSLAVYYQGHYLTTKPVPDHLWRRPLKSISIGGDKFTEQLE